MDDWPVWKMLLAGLAVIALDLILWFGVIVMVVWGVKSVV